MGNTSDNNEAIPSYNNCFTLGGLSKMSNGNLIKVPMFIDKKGEAQKIRDGKDGELKHYYEMTYTQAKQMLDIYMQGNNLPKGADTLRVSLYLDNARFGNFHIFVMDFDKWDEDNDFFKAAKDMADKVTRSQGGGYHMFYGITQEAATPLFDSVNLLTSKSAKSYISKTGAVTLDEKNKVDFFCDAHHFIYEWEEWDNTVALTDKTQELHGLIKANFELKRPMDFNEWEDADDGGITLEGLPEEVMKSQMTDKQQAVFDDLKTYSSDCTSQEWFGIGIDIYHVFGEELGGSVFLWWSKPGHSYNPSGCAKTWDNICCRGQQTRLRNSKWDFAVSAF